MMASNINNNTIRENGNDKRHVNLTMDDVPNGTINDTINLLLRAGNRTDLDKLLFFVQSPGLIGGDDFLQWASDADPTAVVALQRYHRRLQDGDRNTPILTTHNDNQLNINMATLTECYGEMIHGDSTYFISNMEHLVIGVLLSTPFKPYYRLEILRYEDTVLLYLQLLYYPFST